ncbi:EVE domain-containing protein [Pseudoalteromonas ulvae]|uniref:EVE domain-containing protein n=1 Tax=Pseudoalteromonas ulvae TaxID=107327 RepID=A0A244CVU0_PSEDV|nr:EVE domain-containing protein [Pseudoalteromonas ulvae]OUL59757.1 EVE domain-containing protein [Pseudoalteromonas ulvae]
MAFWLFKTEPDVFSIDDLCKFGKADWEGVRNYQARNFLRDQVAINDQVFIYHSSCKIPAIAGIATVIKDAHPDPTQFDHSSPYFDAKASKTDPRWYQVSVKFDQKFIKPITLSQLKSDSNLDDFQLTKKGSRLSIIPLDEGHWNYIIDTYLIKF